MKNNKVIVITIVIVLFVLIGATIFFTLMKNSSEEIESLMFQNETGTIELFDITEKTISAKIILSGNIKNIEFESNLQIEEMPKTKENITEYYLTLLIDKNSHGIAALKVTGDNMTDVQKEIEY